MFLEESPLQAFTCSTSLAFLTVREAERQKEVHSCNLKAFHRPKNESGPGPHFGLSRITSRNVAADDDDMANGVLKVSCLSQAWWKCRMTTDRHYSLGGFTHTQSTFFNFLMYIWPTPHSEYFLQLLDVYLAP